MTLKVLVLIAVTNPFQILACSWSIFAPGRDASASYDACAALAAEHPTPELPLLRKISTITLIRILT